MKRQHSGRDFRARRVQRHLVSAWTVFQRWEGRFPIRHADSSSTESDWVSVAFDAAKSERVKSTLAGRLGMDKDTSRHTRIDGIISCNDYVAGYASEELNDLGYTGSAADINPSITISGIVDNITGKKDLKNSPFPILRSA